VPHPTASKATFVGQGSGRPSSQRTALSWEMPRLLLFFIGKVDYSKGDGFRQSHFRVETVF
jgi:hypothetical protein